jgi:hypothetical protein
MRIPPENTRAGRNRVKPDTLENVFGFFAVSNKQQVNNQKDIILQQR